MEELSAAMARFTNLIDKIYPRTEPENTSIIDNLLNLNPHGLICNTYSPAFGGQIQPCFVKNCHLMEERKTEFQRQAAARVSRA
jgi:hypothetical protein